MECEVCGRGSVDVHDWCAAARDTYQDVWHEFMPEMPPLTVKQVRSLYQQQVSAHEWATSLASWVTAREVIDSKMKSYHPHF